MAKRSMKLLRTKILLGTIVASTLVLGPFCTQGRAQGIQLDRRELMAQNWDELSPKERSRALENYRRFQKLPPEKQRGLEEQYNRWQQLPSQEQERLRRNYNRYRGMNSDQKEEFDKKYKQWRSQER